MRGSCGGAPIAGSDRRIAPLVDRKLETGTRERRGRAEGRRLAFVAALGLLASPAAADGDAADRDARLRRWSPDYASRCLLEEDQGPSGLRELAAGLAASALSGYLTGLLESSDVVLCLDPQAPGCRGYFEPSSRIIALSPALTLSEQLLVVVHELRHVDQVQRGFAPPLSLDRREYVRLVFALEADAQALTSYYAWSEHLAGNPGPWAASATLEHYEDIAAAFAAALEAGDDVALATRAAFSAWYHSEWRRETYYYSTCDHYLDRLDAEHAVPRYGTLPADYFDELCLLPDGTNYGCQRTDEIATAGGRPR
jgi:hypothetical protein